MLMRELENKTRLDRATIRFYEKEGLITPERKENGYRTYSETDVDTLLKVKLLRQLGMSLEKIKALQQGSENFSAALAEQIASLESLIDHAESARQVCIQMREDASSYETLDASYYLKLLEQPALVDRRWKPQYVPEFHQRVLTHPWKRYFARRIDLTVFSTLLYFLLVVVFRIRPVNSFIYQIVNFYILLDLIWIPVEGLLIHHFGTTPGKWLFGIHIESINGGPLPLSNAMHRAWDVLRYGYGFDIPFYSIWRLYRSYRDYKDYGYVQWDYEWGAEYQFAYYYSTKKKVGMGLLIALCLVAFGFSLSESVRPVHRGEDLTLAQLAENHNDYVDSMLEDPGSAFDDMYLKEDGTWEDRRVYGNATIIVDMSGTMVGGLNDYEYELENGYVRSITYEQSWTEVFMLQPISGRIDYTTLAVAGAQDWASIISLREFAEILDQRTEGSQGHIIYENLEIIWRIEAENCAESIEGIYFGSDDKVEAGAVSSLHLYYQIIIHTDR